MSLFALSYLSNEKIIKGSISLASNTDLGKLYAQKIPLVDIACCDLEHTKTTIAHVHYTTCSVVCSNNLSQQISML
jgi:hypothetical protein